MQEGLKRIGIRGIPMEKPDSKLKTTLDSILKVITWQIATTATAFTLGLGFGLGYATTTENYHHIETSFGRAVEVVEKHNGLLDSYDCNINFQYPQPGEIKTIYDEGCNRSIDSVKLLGVKTELPYHRLSDTDQNTSAGIIKDVSYKLITQTK